METRPKRELFSSRAGFSGRQRTGSGPALELHAQFVAVVQKRRWHAIRLVASARTGMHISVGGRSVSLWTAAWGVVFCAGLAWAGERWPDAWTITDAGPDSGTAAAMLEISKLGIAALIGVLVTTVHHQARRKGKSTQPVAHAQILFCVAGALLMIIIGNSLARAFGAFGIASIVRFRTALKDPKEATVLFLLIGLGMSAGRGMLAISGLGTLFVCALLWLLDHSKEDEPRDATLEVRAIGPDFPFAHVQRVLAGRHLAAEPMEMEHGAEAMVRYHVSINGNVSPEEVTAHFLDGGRAGLKSVRWEMPRQKMETSSFRARKPTEPETRSEARR
jgi:hypothetical protein